MAETDVARALRQTLEASTPRTKAVFGGSNAMSAREVETFLAHAPVGLVSTISKSGAPHMTGVGMIFLAGKLYFSANERSALYRNLLRNPAAAIGFMEPSWKHHILIQGTARFIRQESEEIRQVREAYLAQHGWESSLIVGVDIDKLFTWKG